VPAYEYSALNARGRQEKGLIEGDTPRHARQILRERGLSPLQLSEVSEQRATRGAPSPSCRCSPASSPR
jgi:general secretion pathway protein F